MQVAQAFMSRISSAHTPPHPDHLLHRASSTPSAAAAAQQQQRSSGTPFSPRSAPQSSHAPSPFPASVLFPALASSADMAHPADVSPAVHHGSARQRRVRFAEKLEQTEPLGHPPVAGAPVGGYGQVTPGAGAPVGRDQVVGTPLAEGPEGSGRQKAVWTPYQVTPAMQVRRREGLFNLNLSSC